MSDYIIDITIENIHETAPGQPTMVTFYIKIDKNGYLKGFVPKPIWYALYKQGIIKKDADKWKVDLTKRDQIRIPLEVVSPNQASESIRQPKLDQQKLKQIFFSALQYTEEQMTANKQRIKEQLPIYAVGEPSDMLASLQGKPSPLKNIQGFMVGNCGYASIKGLKLNTGYGRFLALWEKQGDAPFRISRNAQYGNALYINLKALTGGAFETQNMEFKQTAYQSFIDKLNELLTQNGQEPLKSLYVWTHID